MKDGRLAVVFHGCDDDNFRADFTVAGRTASLDVDELIEVFNRIGDRLTLLGVFEDEDDYEVMTCRLQ